MIMTASILPGLERLFSGSYDVTVSESNPVLTANYECSNETYLLTERFKLWSAVDKEIVHVYELDSVGSIDGVLEESWKIGLNELNPSKGHRSSNIITILLCDSIDGDTEKKIIRYVRRKSFLFTFNGTVIHRAVAVDMSSKKVINGKGTAKLAEHIHKMIGGDDE